MTPATEPATKPAVKPAMKIDTVLLAEPAQRGRAGPVARRARLRRRLHLRGHRRRLPAPGARGRGHRPHHLPEPGHRLPAQPHAHRLHRMGPPEALVREVHARPGHADQGQHRAPVQLRVVATGRADGRVRAGPQGHLPLLAGRRAARLPRRVLHVHADAADVQPGPQPVRSATRAGRRARAQADPSRRRQRRRPAAAPVHDRALPARALPRQRRRRVGQRGPHPRRLLDRGHEHRVHRTRRRRDGDRGRRHPGPARRSTARPRPTDPCSMPTAGATCSPSSTRCRSRAAGTRWAR